MTSLHDLFSWVCGQWPTHLWSPGGIALPFCQRCTGLYVGACLAIVLEILLRPSRTSRRLWLEGLCLLQMVPLGLHWVPQSDVARTLSGGVFAVGLVGFLSQLPSEHLRRTAAPTCLRRAGTHGLLTASGLAGVVVAAKQGGTAAAHALTVLGFLGAGGLATLGLWTLALLGADIRRRIRLRRGEPVP